MTLPSSKTVFIGLVIAAVIAIVILLFVHNHKLNNAISKLDSAMMRLDTAQVRIDSSQKTITEMKNELNEYQQTLMRLDNSVMSLDIHSKQKEQQFNRTIQSFSGDYDKMKKNFQEHHRTYWPNVAIDTSKER
jgi:uncharacterized membrane-anchored protein YhcB (DUF1043 family)